MTTIKSKQLKVNKTISTTDAGLNIESDNAEPLVPGVYDFQLVVNDDSGNQSSPTIARVIIVDDKKPTAVIDAPSRIGFAEDLLLSAQRSVDIGGKIVEYKWTLIKNP
jgi:hypothetical protein